MKDQIRTLALKCPSCGASLDVSPDMERFACGYCGTSQIVQRRGGTVSLKLISDAISRVQTGTDRTAAELALVRLRQELAAINNKWSPGLMQQQSLSGQPMGQPFQAQVFVPPEWKDSKETAKNPPTTTVINGVFYFAISFFAFFGSLWFIAAENYTAVAAIITVWVALGVPLIIEKIIQNQRDWTTTKLRRQSYIAWLSSEKERILAQIAVKLAIVDHSDGTSGNAD